MYVIIPASDMETSFLPASKPLCKALTPINGKTALQFILDELFENQSFVDEVVIVKRDVSDVEKYIRNSRQDNFFLTKVHCVEGKKYKQPTNQRYSQLDDFYAGVEFLVTEVKCKHSEILVWSADELIFGCGRLFDQTLPSFRCAVRGTALNVFRFNNFSHVVNNLITLHNDLQPHSMDDFVRAYHSKRDEVIVFEDFGEYKRWSDQGSFYALQAELLERDEHSTINVEVDIERNLITKINKFRDKPYSYDVMERSRSVQHNLWSEANFLENADAEQAIFLPSFVERGVNLRGDYCDTVTEELISGLSLSSLLTHFDLSLDTWESILTKIVNALRVSFHKDSLEDDDELYHSYVSVERRECFCEEYISSLKEIVADFAKQFSKDFEGENYFVLSNNDVVEWNIFVDDFAEKFKRRSTKETLIYNGTCERLVHNNLIFGNVKYDAFGNKVTFVNPRSRLWQIVDKNRDYATLYLSTMCGYDALIDGFCREDNGVVSVAENVKNKMLDCTRLLDESLNDCEYLKQYAIVLMLEYAFKEGINSRKKATLLKYASQLKRTFVFNKIIL